MESKVRSLAQVCDLALAGFSSTLYGYKGRVEYATFQPPPDILRQIPEVRFDDSSERWPSVPATAKLDRTALRKRHHVVPDPDWDPPIKKPKFYYPPSKGVKLRDVDELMRESRETKGMSPKEYDEYRRKKQLEMDKASHSTPTAVVPQKQQQQQQQQQQQNQQHRSNASNANPVQDILNEITAASKPRSDTGGGNKTKDRNASGLGVRKSQKDEHLFKKPSATTIQRKGSNSSSSSGSTPATASRGTTSAKSVGKRPTPAPMQKRPCVDLLMIRDHLLDVNSEDRVETRKIANLLKRNVSNAGHMSILIKKKPKLVLHIPKPDKDRNQPEKVTMIGKYKVKHKSGSNTAATPEMKPVVKKERNVKQQQPPSAPSTKSIDIPRDSKEKSSSDHKKSKDVKREPTSPSASSGNDKFTLPTGTVTAEFLKTIRIPKRKPAESSASTPAVTTTTTSTSSSTIVERELEEGETISPSPSPVHRGQQQQLSSSSSSPPPLPSSSTTTAISRERSRSPSPSRRRDRHVRHDEEKRSIRHREERRGTSSDQRREHSVDDRRRHRRDSRQSSSDDLRHQRHRSRSPSTRKHRHDRSSRSRSDSRRRSRSPRRRSSNLSSTNSSCRSKSPPSRSQQPTSSADTPAANTLVSQPSSEPSPPKPNYKNATSADAESEDQCKLFAVMFRKLATAYKHRGDPRQSEMCGLLDHMHAILNYVLSFYYQDFKTNEYSGIRHWESLFPFSSQVLRNLKDRKEFDLYALCCRMMGMVRYYTFVRREATASKKLDTVIKKEVEPTVTEDATKASKQAFIEFEEAYNRFKEADRHLSYEQFRTNYPNTFNNACVKGEYGPGIVIGGEAGTSIEPRYPFIPFAKLHHAAIVCKCMLAEYVEKNAIKYTPIQDYEEYM